MVRPSPPLNIKIIEASETPSGLRGLCVEALKGTFSGQAFARKLPDRADYPRYWLLLPDR
jgi:hypothetical protein